MGLQNTRMRCHGDALLSNSVTRPGWHATTDFETFYFETNWITGDFRTVNLTFRSCMLPWVLCIWRICHFVVACYHVQGCEYQIWATKRWNVLRKCTLKCWVGLGCPSPLRLHQREDKVAQARGRFVQNRGEWVADRIPGGHATTKCAIYISKVTRCSRCNALGGLFIS